MKGTIVTITVALLALAILPLSSGITAGRTDFRSGGTALAGERGTAKVIFKVKCYDEGRAALRGMKGIERIETGFHYFDETDTVYFDQKLVTVEEMESALKKAGTYVETMQEKGRN